MFPDLTPEWYAAAGVYFMTAFIVQTVVPLGTQLLPYFIFMPLSRKMNYPAVRYVHVLTVRSFHFLFCWTSSSRHSNDWFMGGYVVFHLFQSFTLTLPHASLSLTLSISLTLTLIHASLTAPHSLLPSLFQHTHIYTHPRRGQSSHSIVMQAELNMMQVHKNK